MIYTFSVYGLCVVGKQ